MVLKLKKLLRELEEKVLKRGKNRRRVAKRIGVWTQQEKWFRRGLTKKVLNGQKGSKRSKL